MLQVNSVEPDMEDCKRFSGKPVTEKIVQYYRVRYTAAPGVRCLGGWVSWSRHEP